MAKSKATEIQHALASIKGRAGDIVYALTGYAVEEGNRYYDVELRSQFNAEARFGIGDEAVMLASALSIYQLVEQVTGHEDYMHRQLSKIDDSIGWQEPQFAGSVSEGFRLMERQHLMLSGAWKACCREVREIKEGGGLGKGEKRVLREFSEALKESKGYIIEIKENLDRINELRPFRSPDRPKS